MSLYTTFKVVQNEFKILLEDTKELESSFFDLLLHRKNIDYDLEYIDDDVLEYTFHISNATKVINLISEFNIKVIKIKR
jgi:hypothetical protein